MSILTFDHRKWVLAENHSWLTFEGFHESYRIEVADGIRMAVIT